MKYIEIISSTLRGLNMHHKHASENTFLSESPRIGRNFGTDINIIKGFNHPLSSNLKA